MSMLQKCGACGLPVDECMEKDNAKVLDKLHKAGLPTFALIHMSQIMREQVNEIRRREREALEADPFLEAALTQSAETN